ncbi:glycoside hydrolase family 97 protein [uncultured Muribaculum sp.]|uniref:glycoside hydrolase family 97 protein n=1 Tax=uncultured Muribaculum sp. TaxID=1918613 RepID=UPI002599687D|nr:glycoside hydrolase family 97 protein [uncultured Muribaculum sp.]
MKTSLISFFCIGMLSLSSCGPKTTAWEAVSPDGNVKFIAQNTADGDSRKLEYKILYKDSAAIDFSDLGLTMNGYNYGANAKFKDIQRQSIDEAYTLKSGKKTSTRNRCEEMTLTFSDDNAKEFQLIVRVFDDGAAFRYGFPETSADTCTITEEMTEFVIADDGKAWIHPYDWNERHKPSYEQYSENGIAINTPSPNEKGWAFPMLFEAGDKWMMITEAYLDGTYPATHVDNSGRNGAYKIRFPEKEEPIIPDDPQPKSTTPWYTPWRAVIIGSDLNTIFTTQMVAHLNPASVVEDTEWIKPGRSAWSWWYEGRSVLDYKKQLKYVDFCRDMGWEYSLIDAGWQRMDGKGVEGVVDYANKNGVGIWLWYHSGSGSDETSSPQRRIMADPELRKAEMARISKMGVKGIKVDFFDTDKQRVIELYPAILKDAADNHLMVDLHGATLPRGFERTYPNLMTTEAIRGAETLGRQPRCDAAAAHNATVPFTRNVVGSMDYTPVTFSNKIRQGVEAFRRTSMAHQLALATVFESGFQCFADRMEGYTALPELPKNYLKEVPAAWDESRLLAGYPSDYAVVARKSGDKWFIGAISGVDKEREITFNLPEECIGKKFTLIKDGKDINSFDYEEITSDDGKVTVKVLGNGGFAAII